MTRQESIDEIRALILDLGKYLTSPIQGVRYRAKKQYAELINRFFRENKNFLAQQQSLACLDDIQYFMSFLQAAEDYYNCESMEQTPSCNFHFQKIQKGVYYSPSFTNDNSDSKG